MEGVEAAPRLSSLSVAASTASIWNSFHDSTLIALVLLFISKQPTSAQMRVTIKLCNRNGLRDGRGGKLGAIHGRKPPGRQRSMHRSIPPDMAMMVRYRHPPASCSNRLPD